MFDYKWTNVRQLETSSPYATHYVTNGRFRTKIGAMLAAYTLSGAYEIETVRIDSM